VGRTIFITGTDTGVGKTVLTALLLRHLRLRGVNALAMKPFCSGGRDDAELLWAVQKNTEAAVTARGNEVTLDEINPFYYSLPLAPWVAVQYRRSGKNVPLRAVLQKISELQKKCDVLLIEGSGGVLVPLGDGYAVLDLIRKLRCQVLIAARNKLGTINHALLTVKAVEAVGIKEVVIVWADGAKVDKSAETNLDVIKKWGNGSQRVRVFGVPYLGKKASSLRGIEGAEKKLKKVLAAIWKCV
jgi:dethiobiotin synthetase